MKKIAIVNGPNLNLVGIRQPEIYGAQTFEQYFAELDQFFQNVELIYLQSNVEGELINFLHDLNAQADIDGIVLNAGGYTHTSIAIGDAVAGIKKPVVEVHISNLFKREDFRQVSYIAGPSVGSISGFGLKSYKLAVQSFLADE